MTTEVMAARWFDKVRIGSCGSFVFVCNDKSCGIDHTWRFESSEPVMIFVEDEAIHETGCRCAADVETCLPVQT